MDERGVIFRRRLVYLTAMYLSALFAAEKWPFLVKTPEIQYNDDLLVAEQTNL